MKRFLELLLFLCVVVSCSRSDEPYIKEEAPSSPKVVSELYYTDMETPVPYLLVDLSYNAFGKLKKRTSIDYHTNEVLKFSEFKYSDSGVLSQVCDYELNFATLEPEAFQLKQVKQYSYLENGMLSNEQMQLFSDYSVETANYCYNDKSALSHITRFVDNDLKNHVDYDYDKHGLLEVKTIFNKNNFVLSWFEYEYHNNLLSKMTLFNSRGIIEMEQFYHYNTYNQLILLEQNDRTKSKLHGTFIVRYEYQSEFDL